MKTSSHNAAQELLAALALRASEDDESIGVHLSGCAECSEELRRFQSSAEGSSRVVWERIVRRIRGADE